MSRLKGPILEDWLEKKKRSGFKLIKWQKRFVVIQNGAMFYAKTEKNGGTDFFKTAQRILLRKIKGIKKCDKDREFIIQHVEKGGTITSLLWRAATATRRTKWYDTIRDRCREIREQAKIKKAEKAERQSIELSHATAHSSAAISAAQPRAEESPHAAAAASASSQSLAKTSEKTSSSGAKAAAPDSGAGSQVAAESGGAALASSLILFEEAYHCTLEGGAMKVFSAPGDAAPELEIDVAKAKVQMKDGELVVTDDSGDYGFGADAATLAKWLGAIQSARLTAGPATAIACGVAWLANFLALPTGDDVAAAFEEGSKFFELEEGEPEPTDDSERNELAVSQGKALLEDLRAKNKDCRKAGLLPAITHFLEMYNCVLLDKLSEPIELTKSNKIPQYILRDLIQLIDLHAVVMAEATEGLEEIPHMAADAKKRFRQDRESHLIRVYTDRAAQILMPVCARITANILKSRDEDNIYSKKKSGAMHTSIPFDLLQVMQQQLELNLANAKAELHGSPTELNINEAVVVALLDVVNLFVRVLTRQLALLAGSGPADDLLPEIRASPSKPKLQFCAALANDFLALAQELAKWCCQHCARLRLVPPWCMPPVAAKSAEAAPPVPDSDTETPDGYPAEHPLFETLLNGRKIAIHCLLDSVFLPLETENRFNKLFEKPLATAPLEELLQTLHANVLSQCAPLMGQGENMRMLLWETWTHLLIHYWRALADKGDKSSFSHEEVGAPAAKVDFLPLFIYIDRRKLIRKFNYLDRDGKVTLDEFVGTLSPYLPEDASQEDFHKWVGGFRSSSKGAVLTIDHHAFLVKLRAAQDAMAATAGGKGAAKPTGRRSLVGDLTRLKRFLRAQTINFRGPQTASSFFLEHVGASLGMHEALKAFLTSESGALAVGSELSVLVYPHYWPAANARRAVSHEIQQAYMLCLKLMKQARPLEEDKDNVALTDKMRSTARQALDDLQEQIQTKYQATSIANTREHEREIWRKCIDPFWQMFNAPAGARSFEDVRWDRDFSDGPVHPERHSLTRKASKRGLFTMLAHKKKTPTDAAHHAGFNFAFVPPAAFPATVFENGAQIAEEEPEEVQKGSLADFF